MERMDIFAVLALMIFAHIVDDYYLQGVLAKMKQKSWWEQNAPDEKYKNDYKIALMCHAWSWAIMITIPAPRMYTFWVLRKTPFNNSKNFMHHSGIK